MATFDLFEHPEKQPLELASIVAKYSEILECGSHDNYAVCREFKLATEAAGFTFEHSLDGVPFGLQAIASPEELKQAEEAGSAAARACECAYADGFDANPHEKGSALHEAWAKGFSGEVWRLKNPFRKVN